MTGSKGRVRDCTSWFKTVVVFCRRSFDFPLSKGVSYDSGNVVLQCATFVTRALAQIEITAWESVITNASLLSRVFFSRNRRVSKIIVFGK